MAEDLLAGPVAVFTEMENIRQRQERPGSDLTRGLIAQALESAENRLDELCSPIVVRDALVKELNDVDRAQDDLTFLRSLDSGENLQEKIAACEAEIEERRQNPRYRLAAHMMGTVSVKEEAEIAEPDSDAELAKQAADEFLSQPPEELAKQLVGKWITYRGKRVAIKNVRPQDGEYNANYLRTRPLFGPGRRHVYVANVMGGNVMLFLCAGSPDTADSCVSIQAGTFRGEELKNANSVAKALELPKEHIGDIELDGDKIKIVRLEPRKKK